MAKTNHSLIRIYGFAMVLSVLLLLFVGLTQGLSAFLTVLVLAGLEITFSFDNAIINAKILQRMNRLWQTLFMTVGIFVAVFVVRVLLPVFIVSVTSGTHFKEVIHLVLHQPEQYTHKLEVAQPLIAIFGGIFLLMIFLDFIFEHRKIKWFVGIETLLARVGKIENASTTIALSALLGTSFWFVGIDDRLRVLVAGLIGLMTYLVINALDSIGSPAEGAVQATAKLGIVGFLYLELIDASFSLDGVIGAFAISKSVLLIAVGLGIGALFVRSMTVHMLRRGVLARYVYLEHGAHYAIGFLAIFMLVSIKTEVPQFITGGVGLVVIMLALIHSHREVVKHESKKLV
jgi:hypothetical protein